MKLFVREVVGKTLLVVFKLPKWLRKQFVAKFKNTKSYYLEYKIFASIFHATITVYQKDILI